MTKSIKQLLHLDQVKHSELPQIITSYFRHAQFLGSRLKIYKQESPDECIELIFNKSGTTIVNAIASSTVPQEALRDIEKAIIDALVENQTVRYHQVAAKSAVKVEGYYRYRDLFQILPVPQYAPRPPFLIGEHPFLLEFPYTSSLDIMINGTRAQELANKYSRLLNLFLLGSVHLMNDMTQHRWVLPKDFNEHMVSEHLQRGYIYPGLGQMSGSLSSIDGISEISNVPFQEYYGSTYVYASAGNIMAIPDNLAYSLDLALALLSDDWIKLYMACTWFSQAERLWNESYSSAFIALVSAMECLTDKPERCSECGQALSERMDKCRVCHQAKFSITKHFKSLLDKYVPFVNTPEWKSTKNRIYTVRSELAHGLDLLLRDLDPSFHIGVKTVDEDQMLRDLYFITRLCIYNWLHSRTNYRQ
jgi:hypothetical protein